MGLQNLNEKLIDIRTFFWKLLFKITANLQPKHIVFITIGIIIIAIAMIVVFNNSVKIEEVIEKAETEGEQAENEVREIFDMQTDEEIADSSHVVDTHTSDRVRTDTELDNLGDIAKDNLRRRLLNFSR